MASFDIDTFLKVQGQQGAGAFEAVGMSFGMPSCMLNLAGNVLSILPANVLLMMKKLLSQATAGAQAKINAIFQKLFLLTGLKEILTEDGIFSFIGDANWMDIDSDTAQLLADLGGVLAAFQVASQTAADIYQNVQDIKGLVDSAKDCLDKFKTIQDFQSGNSANQKAIAAANGVDYDQVYQADKAMLQEATDFVEKCVDSIKAIDEVLAARAADPSLEPKFLDSADLNAALEGTSYERYPAIDPNIPQPSPDEQEVFRLVYGPPVSQDGSYLLTSDGLYYDSQAGGIDPVLLAISGTVATGDKWNYEYDANLGGKGDAISLRSLNGYTDNIFDPERIDDGKTIREFYKKDHFLKVLKQQRDKRIFDLSGELQGYIDDPAYGPDSSVVKNQRQMIMSELAINNGKIDRRKKQIEVALKVPMLYGNLEKPIFVPGQPIPINDFSFLKDYNIVVDLEKQKKLVFEAAEVVGVVLPIKPTFVVAPPPPPSITYSHLYVPPVGKGGMIYSPSGPVSGTFLSLVDEISTDKLFATYNFLESDVVLPSSIAHNVTNCASPGSYNDAKLVAPNSSGVFFSGLSIPYLEGIVRNKGTDATTYPLASSLGSFVRLPNTKEFRDLTYSPEGFTVEFWTHVPNIMDGDIGWLSSTTSSLTKVVLGNENTGIIEAANVPDPLPDLDYIEKDLGNSYVRGMLMGFTRDRRITQELTGYSYKNYDNDPVSSLSFFIAPTQSRDSSSCSWVNKKLENCLNVPQFHKMKVDLSATNFGNVSSQFVLVDVVVDPSANELSLYADGSLVATSALDVVFGTTKFKPLNLPTFKTANSFEYSSTTVNGPTTLHDGPKLGQFYTPWIVGGGYTDGMYKYGNFMGGGPDYDSGETGSSRAGYISGLRGHVGSLKFYAKPLRKKEVLKNYNAQQGYFKSIKT